MNSQLVEKLTTRWNGPNGRPLSGKLISTNLKDGDSLPPDCMCAQGWVLFESGCTLKQIKEMEQAQADRDVAAKLGISLTHSVILRQINDSLPGSPSIVLSNPEKILGNKSHQILAFWRHLDLMTPAVGDAVGDAVGVGATAEIQGSDIFKRDGRPFFFLPFFGINNLDDLN